MTAARATSLEWVLRVGAFMCFVGHGAFGIITKEAWVPYFGVAGIGRDMAFRLMPLVGALDILMGCLMLMRPRPAIAYWMIAWATWTALLRPLTGESGWEALERAGNYGVPAALAVLTMPPSSWRELFGGAQLRVDHSRRRRAGDDPLYGMARDRPGGPRAVPPSAGAIALHRGVEARDRIAL